MMPFFESSEATNARARSRLCIAAELVDHETGKKALESERREDVAKRSVRTQVIGVLEALGSDEQHRQRPLRHLPPR